MNNREVFVKDPITRSLPNNGVANVNDGTSAEDLKVLRFELETFVCDGKYADGLSRILDSFLKHIDASQQQGVWVSGFFGSGKSHLVKMLRALWIDTIFPDGAAARGVAELPQEIRDQLKELSVAAKRHGGLHAVSGTLGSGASTSVRLALLQLIFKSVGLPTFYPAARFVLRLHKEGIFEEVKREVEQAGYDWEEELDNFYVAEGLHQALVHSKPQVYPTESSCVETFNNLYPNREDVSNDELIKALREALERNGKMPLTLIVFDEVQQFIGSSLQRSMEVQEMVETLSKHAGGRVMFIGTGQTAITGMSNLKKLEGRFPVRVELSEADVEGVIRKVILAKKPEAKPAIEAVIEKNRGEIAKHLSGTALAHRAADNQVFAADYPILPTRRRFWEQALRVLDQTGTDSQLRNQLSMILKVIQQYAERPLGHVIPADILYFDAAEKLLQARMVPANIYGAIQKWQAGDSDDQLRARTCALIFLINKISGKQNEVGIYANIETIADLLVENLSEGSAPIRSRLSAILETTKLVMKVEHTYRLQTEESAAWNDDFQNKLLNLNSEANRVESARHERIKKRLENGLESLSFVQGHAKVPREPSLHFGTPSAAEGNTFSVWVQHGFLADEKDVRTAARQAGAESALLYVYLPAKSRDALNKAVRDELAAGTVLEQREMQMTADGQEARSAMETIWYEAKRTIKDLVDDMIAGARVFMGGGQEVQGSSLVEALKEAGQSALQRLYPKFSIGDTPGWDKVYEQAQKGVPDALKKIGYEGEVDHHPVCKQLLSMITSSKKGAEIRAFFESPDYGWPKDTIDGALQVMLVSGKLSVKIGTQPVLPNQLARKDIGKAEFSFVSVVLTTAEKLQVRKLYQKLGISCRTNEELVHAQEFLHLLEGLAVTAGGDPPCPKKPDTKFLDELRNISGNAQLKAFLQQQETLTGYIETWKKQKDAISKLLPKWKRLKELSAYAEGLEDTDVIISQIGYIEEHRKLLDEADTITANTAALTQVLRSALDSLLNSYNRIYDEGITKLEADPAWDKLSPEDRYEVLNTHQLRLDQQPKADLSTTETLLSSLQNVSMASLQDRMAALPHRFESSRGDAVKKSEPKAKWVTIAKPQLNSREELESWILEVKKDVEKALDEGPVLIR